MKTIVRTLSLPADMKHIIHKAAMECVLEGYISFDDTKDID